MLRTAAQVLCQLTEFFRSVGVCLSHAVDRIDGGTDLTNRLTLQSMV